MCRRQKNNTPANKEKSARLRLHDDDVHLSGTDRILRVHFSSLLLLPIVSCLDSSNDISPNVTTYDTLVCLLVNVVLIDIASAQEFFSHPIICRTDVHKGEATWIFAGS